MFEPTPRPTDRDLLAELIYEYVVSAQLPAGTSEQKAFHQAQELLLHDVRNRALELQSLAEKRVLQVKQFTLGEYLAHRPKAATNPRPVKTPAAPLVGAAFLPLP